MANTQEEATVTALSGKERKRYAVTRLNSSLPHIRRSESITFSLSGAWTGECEPVVGQIVLLERITRFLRGWRAIVARPCNRRRN